MTIIDLLLLTLCVLLLFGAVAWMWSAGCDD